MKEVSAKMNDLYQDSNQLFAKLRSESQGLKGEKEYKKYTDKLLDQLQIIINRLHEIELTVVQNEAEFHQALVRIQGDIRTRNLEVSHQKEKYKDSIIRKDQTILELMTDKRMHEDVAESNKEYYHDIIAQKERTITDLLEEKRNFQVTIRNLNTELRDVKEQTFNTLQNEVRGQRDNLAGAVNNVAHSYQHILVLTKENNNLKNEIISLKQKLEIGEKRSHGGVSNALEEENKDLKLQLQAANRRIQGLKLEMEEIVLTLKTKKITPDLSGKPENQRVMPLVGSKLTKWPYQDRYSDPGREDFVQNELIRLEKELRRGYDAGIIDNTEYTKEIFQILNKVNELRRKEKLQQKDQLKEVQKMAEEKVDALKNELEKEGSHMDKEVTNFQKEIAEWKKENEYLSNMVRRLDEATNELQEELKKLTKEKIKQDNELIQKQVMVTRLERQVQDLASRLAEQRLPSITKVPGPEVGSQMSIQQKSGDGDGGGVSPARSRNVSNLGSDPRRKDTTASNAKPKVIGREFVGFTGDFEYYRRKNEEMMRSTVGSLSSFYEGLLRLDKLDPKIVKKKMNGGLEAILELTRAVPIEEEPEDDYPQQTQQKPMPTPTEQDYGAPSDQQQQGGGGYDGQEEDQLIDDDEDDEEDGQNNQGPPQKEIERDEDEKDGFTGKVWGIYNPNKENDAFRTDEEEETKKDSDTRVEDETREPEIEIGNAENFKFEEIPDVLPNKYHYGGNLDVVRKDARLAFQEFAIRWKASDQDDITRTKLIQMVRTT